MKFRILFIVTILMAVVVSCAPKQAPESQSTQLAVTQPVPTAVKSGKGELVATDPSTFFIISGEYQLVEFFGFT